MMKPFFYLLTCAVFLTCCSVHAPLRAAEAEPVEEPIEPDRPGFTNGSGTVAPGRVVFENGIARTRDKSSNGGAVTTDFPETLIRIGATSNLEAQIGVPNYSAVRGGDSGFGDALLGVKWKFYQSRDGKTRASLAPGFTLPVGSRSFGTPSVDPIVTLGVDTALNQRTKFAANLVLTDPSQSGAQSNNGGGGGGNVGGGGSGGGGRNFTVTPAASLGYSLTPKLGAYIDAYAILPQRGASASVFDGGFAYLLTNDVQLDIEAGVGLGGAAPSSFVGAGVSFRF